MHPVHPKDVMHALDAQVYKPTVCTATNTNSAKRFAICKALHKVVGVCFFGVTHFANPMIYNQQVFGFKQNFCKVLSFYKLLQTKVLPCTI